MEITSAQPHPKLSGLALEQVAANPQLSDSEKLHEASRQFEAIFLRQILATAQKPTVPSKINPPSFASGIYQDMLSSELADQISRSGTFGLAQSLESQLAQQLHGNQAVAQPGKTGVSQPPSHPTPPHQAGRPYDK